MTPSERRFVAHCNKQLQNTPLTPEEKHARLRYEQHMQFVRQERIINGILWAGWVLLLAMFLYLLVF